ncbi:hypothetical protein NDU88_006908 [Pleurodeles waltl]|uniref:Uncharacterized protein n=1 Tax=Pleurodeles waltl TaxID=8319 RepID=A0AAV7LRT3_PLEWA|nr:hypothetical protein NDU88_006908 [Pleurodeles waltl]
MLRRASRWLSHSKSALDPSVIRPEGQAVSHPQRQPKGPLVGLRDPRQKGQKKSDTGRHPRGIRTRRRERSGVGAARRGPAGGELSLTRTWGCRNRPPVRSRVL